MMAMRYEWSKIAVKVIEASGARERGAGCTAHAGWIAIELRRQLMERIPRIVLIDWLILDPPPPVFAQVEEFAFAQKWTATRTRVGFS
jgi:hypothetical protein